MKWKSTAMLVFVVALVLLVPVLAPPVAAQGPDLNLVCPAPPAADVQQRLNTVPEISVIAGKIGVPEDLVAADNIRWDCRYGWIHGVTNWTDDFKQRLNEYAREVGAPPPFTSGDYEAPLTLTYRLLNPVYERIHNRNIPE